MRRSQAIDPAGAVEQAEVAVYEAHNVSAALVLESHIFLRCLLL